MTDRILDFADAPARLRVRYQQLVVQREAQPQVTVPLRDVAVVIVSHPQVTYTQAVLSGLAAAGGSFVACDRANLPVGMFLPLAAHYAQVERVAAQASASKPLRKRLWREVVRAKIAAQADALERLHGTDHGLRTLIPLVKSGDPANVEARAARRYWPQIFADSQFRRNRDDEDQNILLNYGYAVLRAIIARAVCAAGLHPSLGLHHHNRYDAFCLADDLMEPFRATVDLSVAEYVNTHDAFRGLESAAKQAILSDLTARYQVQGQQRTLFDAAARMTSSLAAVFTGQASELEIPDW